MVFSQNISRYTSFNRSLLWSVTLPKIWYFGRVIVAEMIGCFRWLYIFVCNHLINTEYILTLFFRHNFTICITVLSLSQRNKQSETDKQLNI